MRRQRLVEARKAVGKSQEQVAHEVGVDRTTVGKWERDESTPHVTQRPAYAEAIGLTLSELAAILSSMPQGDNDTPEWLSTYLGMEQSANELRAHEPAVVYGLLQLPAYTEAVVRRVGLSEVPDSYIRNAVEQRQYRQTRIRDGSLDLDVIQTEHSLRTRIGEADVMAGQLTALADAAEERPNVTVRVATFDAGLHEAGRLGTFVIMTHPWGNPRAWIEGYGGGHFITDADEVAYFAQAYDQAVRLALPPTDSVTFIRQLAAEWEARR